MSSIAPGHQAQAAQPYQTGKWRPTRQVPAQGWRFAGSTGHASGRASPRKALECVLSREIVTGLPSYPATVTRWGVGAMLYALWTIVGLLAAILLVQIVALTSRINYGSALLTVIQQLDDLRGSARWQTEKLSDVIEKVGTKIERAIPEVPDHHQAIIDAIENVGTKNTHIGECLKWIAASVDQTENNTGLIAMNTAPHSPSTDGMVWDTDLPAKT